MGGSQILSELLRRKINSLPVPGFEPGLLDHPARSLVSVLFKQQISQELPVFKVEQQLGLNTYMLRNINAIEIRWFLFYLTTVVRHFMLILRQASKTAE
jgi:hypothetical protein